jgi:hypothetical protein
LSLDEDLRTKNLFGRYRPPGFAALANGREISTVFAPRKAAAGKYVRITRTCGKYV